MPHLFASSLISRQPNSEFSINPAPTLHDPIIRLFIPGFHPRWNGHTLQFPLRPNVRRLAEIHLLIQRPRFNANPLRRLWIVMVNANTTVRAKDTTANTSRVAFTLEMTNVFLG